MSGFISRDPTLPAFWDERFERAFTPWDRGGVPQQLRDFVARSPRPLRTLIPGCGSAWELVHLCEAGWDATAIDFSPAAVATAKAAAGPWAAHVQTADFFTWQSDAPLELLYERAFLCALPPAMWPSIGARWAELLAPGALLAGFFFFDATAKGPPFGIAMPQLERMLAPHFTKIEDAPVSDSVAVFAGKERWQVWQRRA
ncbi:MAG: methyltransferase domain-containing protein [Pseudomonadota bacterium]